mgnify:CR=1 FL=1
MNNNFYMSDKDLKILKKSINKVKKNKIFKDFEKEKKVENIKINKASAKVA